jgi:2-polyprenyl-3-methyl-5-hydroxy-6-metoxy-1,4-benzoquinol methylase
MKGCNSLNNCDNPRITAFTVNQHDILDCISCSQRFTMVNEDSVNHLSKIYSDAYFFEGKDGYPNYLEEKEIITNHGIRYAQLMQKYNCSGKILDVGCAAGFFLKGFQMNGWECSGLEPNSTMAEYGNKELDLNISVGSLESFNSNEQYDLVSLIQVVGHFYDIDIALENVYRLLKPGGLVLVESWNRASLVAKIFGKSWHEYSPPSVIHWFTDYTLNDIFNMHNFKFVDKGYPKKQINLKHALSLVDGKTPKFPGKKQAVGFLSSTFGNLKVYYPPLDLKWYLFQKAV